MRPGLIFCLGLALANPVAAHHSRAAFDLDNSVEVEGTVTEVGWTNPHYYLSVREMRDEGVRDWTFEGHSVPGLVRNGWSKDSLKVGERVRVVANPNRQAAVTFALLDHVTRADGKTFYAFRPPPEREAAPKPPLAPSTDFSGTWRLIRSLRDNLVGGFDAPEDWPLTVAGREEVAGFNPEDDPSLSCEPRGIPRMLAWPYSQQWQRVDDGFRITIEHATDTRRIYESGGADAASVHDLGVSRGHMRDDGIYEIVTDGFLPKRWGITRGLNSTADKRVVERYELIEDGYRLRLTYTVTDSARLQEPVSETLHYARVHDFDFADEPPCDVATAQRHLDYE